MKSSKSNIFFRVTKTIRFLIHVLFDESKKRHFILKSLIFTLIYLKLSVLLINYKSFLSYAFAPYPIFSKIKLLTLIFTGTLLSLTPLDLTLLSIVSLLFGLNVELVLRKLRFLAGQKGLHVTLGAGIISLVAAGCASCGLSLASLVGLSGAIALLPFHGIELYILSICILLASLFYNLSTLVRVCKIKAKPGK